jgi:8-oxo-dGTP pyrophosphatase MutT (NUDIX family)
LSRPGEGRVSPTRLDPIAIPQLPSGALNLEGPPSTPRPSATVLLVRGKKPWELLLMRRPRGADFAPGAYVFPGGVVHDEDSQWGDEIAVAAVRELFEEVGILLARNGRRFAREADCRRVRALVGAGQSFGSALRSTGLEPALDRLVLLARWVTPAQMRRRYDARFYLARLPAGQNVHPQSDEVSDWLWVTPKKALGEDEITLVYATQHVLRSVAGDGDASSLFRRVRRLSNVPIVEPRMTQSESGWEIAH